MFLRLLRKIVGTNGRRVLVPTPVPAINQTRYDPQFAASHPAKYTTKGYALF